MSSQLGLQTGGSPYIATSEMLNTIQSGGGLPSNVLDMLDDNPDFLIETNEHSPSNNYGNSPAAERFRKILEHNYPGITKRMKELQAQVGGGKHGNRRLMMLAFAETLQNQGRPPTILTDDEGMLELLDSRGFNTLDSSEFKAQIKKDLHLEPDTPSKKKEFSEPKYQEKSIEAVESDQRRTESLDREQVRRGLSERQQQIEQEKPKKSLDIDF